MTKNTEAHPEAGRTVPLARHPDDLEGNGGPVAVQIEDWWDHLTGGSWMYAEGNPAALKYAMRTGLGGGIGTDHVPMDDAVVYVKIGGFGHLVHQKELEASR